MPVDRHADPMRAGAIERIVGAPVLWRSTGPADSLRSPRAAWGRLRQDASTLKGLSVSDPYNSPGTAAPPVSPYAPPAAALQATPDPISRLAVSETWKRRFRLIERAGGPALPDFRSLPAKERFGLNFNFLAFFFGPIYYLIKGLWRQAVVYLACAVALVMVFELMGLGQFARGVGYGVAAVYAMRANVSYYRKVVLGDAPWF